LAAKRNISDSYSTSQVYTQTEVDSLVSGSGGLTAAEQTWVTNGQTNVTQTATGITALNFDNFGALKAKNSSGTMQTFMRGRDNNDNTVLYYGSNGLRFENSSAEYGFSMFQDKTSVFNNHMYIKATNGELRIQGDSASDSPGVFFSTPATGQNSYKAGIRCYGKNDNGKNQLAFLVSTSSADTTTTNADAALIVDAGRISVGNPAIGTTPGSTIDCRDGNIELSDSGIL